MPNFKVYKLLFPDLICTDVNLPGLKVRQDDIDDAWERHFDNKTLVSVQYEKQKIFYQFKK